MIVLQGFQNFSPISVYYMKLLLNIEVYTVNHCWGSLDLKQNIYEKSKGNWLSTLGVNTGVLLNCKFYGQMQVIHGLIYYCKNDWNWSS